MIHSVKFKCVLDTNVIYPLWTRDLLMWFAHLGGSNKGQCRSYNYE